MKIALDTHDATETFNKMMETMGFETSYSPRSFGIDVSKMNTDLDFLFEVQISGHVISRGKVPKKILGIIVGMTYETEAVYLSRVSDECLKILSNYQSICQMQRNALGATQETL